MQQSHIALAKLKLCSTWTFKTYISKIAAKSSSFILKQHILMFQIEREEREREGDRKEGV